MGRQIRSRTYYSISATLPAELPKTIYLLFPHVSVPQRIGEDAIKVQKFGIRA